MATSIILRSARSALRSTNLATRCLPATSTGATAWTATGSGNMARLFSSKPPNTFVDLETKEYRKVFEVTDEVVSSEAKLRAFFLKWLSHNEGHFDIKDEEAFKERFEIFKEDARAVNAWNKGGHSYTCGINPYSDLTTEEFVSGQINSKKSGFHQTRGRSLRGINPYSDLTTEEFVSGQINSGFHQTRGRALRSEVNQVTVGGVRFVY